MGIRETNMYLWIAKQLPKKIVYFCTVHLMAYATTGKYGSTEVPALAGMEALKRFGDDYNI